MPCLGATRLWRTTCSHGLIFLRRNSTGLALMCVVMIRPLCGVQAKKGKKYVRLFFPFCCWQWKRSGQFINRCTVGVFQYVAT